MKICFVSISYPRNSGDYVLPSLHIEGKLLSEDHRVDVVTSNDTTSPTFKEFDGVRVHRFNYFIKRFQVLTHSGGLISKLRERWYYWLMIPSFLIFFTIKILKVAKHCDVIHAHWSPSAFLSLPVKILFKKPILVALLGGDVSKLVPEVVSSKLSAKRKTHT